MNNSLIEEKRNKLNLDIRGILAVIDLIDDKEKEYEDYITILQMKMVSQINKLNQQRK